MVWCFRPLAIWRSDSDRVIFTSAKETLARTATGGSPFCFSTRARFGSSIATLAGSVAGLVAAAGWSLTVKHPIALKVKANATEVENARFMSSARMMTRGVLTFYKRRAMASRPLGAPHKRIKLSSIAATRAIQWPIRPRYCLCSTRSPIELTPRFRVSILETLHYESDKMRSPWYRSVPFPHAFRLVRYLLKSWYDNLHVGSPSPPR
jgi:hypothetical protein